MTTVLIFIKYFSFDEIDEEKADKEIFIHIKQRMFSFIYYSIVSSRTSRNIK